MILISQEDSSFLNSWKPLSPLSKIIEIFWTIDHPQETDFLRRQSNCWSKLSKQFFWTLKTLSKYASNLIVAGSLTHMMLSVLWIKIQMDTLLLKMSVPSFLIMTFTSPQKKFNIFSEDLIKDLMEKYVMESFSQN